MHNLLIKFLEIALFGLVFCGIYWVVGFFCKSTFGFEIRSERGYAIAMFAGFISRVIIVKFLSGQY